VYKKKSFLVHERKKQNIEVDGSASSKSQGMYMKHVGFPSPVLESALQIPNFNLRC